MSLNYSESLLILYSSDNSSKKIKEETPKSNYYIGVEMVKAEPMSNEGTPGYLVTDPVTGLRSWLPREIFKKRYFKISQSDKLTEPDIKNFLYSGDIQVEKRGEKSTLVEVEFPSGWKDYEVSSCVDPKNYNQELGKKYALENIENRLWKHLGFLLQWAIHGLSKKF